MQNWRIYLEQWIYAVKFPVKCPPGGKHFSHFWLLSPAWNHNLGLVVVQSSCWTVSQPRMDFGPCVCRPVPGLRSEWRAVSSCSCSSWSSTPRSPQVGVCCSCPPGQCGFGWGAFPRIEEPLSDQQVLIQLPKESSWSLYHSWQICWKWCPLGSSQKRSPERIRHEGSWAWSGGDRKGGGQSTGRSQVVTAPCTLTPRKQASQIFGKPIHADSIYILILLRSLSFYLKSKRSSGKVEACWLLSFGRALSGKFGKRMLWRDLCLWRSKRSIWKWRDHCMYPHRELTRFLIIQTAAAFEGTISQRDKATFTTGLLTREVDLILILQMRKHREVKWFSASS